MRGETDVIVVMQKNSRKSLARHRTSANSVDRLAEAEERKECKNSRRADPGRRPALPSAVATSRPIPPFARLAKGANTQWGRESKVVGRERSGRRRFVSFVSFSLKIRPDWAVTISARSVLQYW
jgi:hypothetical protein